jgi:hypothetical protein
MWSWAPKGGPTPRDIGRLTVGSKFNSTPLHLPRGHSCVPTKCGVRGCTAQTCGGGPQVVQPLGSVPAFYGTRRFITEFTRALRLYLS